MAGHKRVFAPGVRPSTSWARIRRDNDVNGGSRRAEAMPPSNGYARPQRYRLRKLFMSTLVSPNAPTDIPEMPAIAGVKLAAAAAGIRYKGRTDVLLAVMDKGTAVAGVFTRSKCASAPVEWCRARLGSSKG